MEEFRKMNRAGVGLHWSDFRMRNGAESFSSEVLVGHKQPRNKMALQSGQESRSPRDSRCSH